ncbi:MAG: COG1361 S-layer family protein [Candidatus Pacearchaeota archaeon]
MNKKIILASIFLLLSLSLVSSLSVNNVVIDQVQPGEEGVIRIDVENEGNTDVDDVSLSVKFLPNIVPIGSSEGFVNEIKEDDEEEFNFKFKVSNVLLPGTYTLDYELKYEEDGDVKLQNGEIGIVVFAQPDLEVTLDPQNPIIGKTGTLNMRIVNKGLADARFVSVEVEGEGVIFVSDRTSYVGTIDSDDFETTSFEVVYQKKRPTIEVTVSYRDFDNQELSTSRDISFATYTEQEAIEKGILTKNNVPLYVGIIIIAIILWIIIRRTIKKRKENKF